MFPNFEARNRLDVNLSEPRDDSLYRGRLSSYYDRGWAWSAPGAHRRRRLSPLLKVGLSYDRARSG